MKQLNKEVKIGISFILALILLYVGINFLKGVNIFKPTNSYTVVFDDVTGLTLSSPVMLNGLQIGLVNSMVLDGSEDNLIDVQVNLTKGIKIPKESRVILDVSIMGTANILIEQNRDSKEYYTPDDKIPGIKNKGMMESASAAIPEIAKLLPKLDSILSGVETLVNNPALSQTIENTSIITAELAIASKQLNKMLSKDVSKMSENMNVMTENLATASTQLKAIDIESTYKSIDLTMKNIQSLTDKLNSNDNSLGLLLNDKSLHDSLSTTLGTASQLLQDVKENPSKYINVKVF